MEPLPILNIRLAINCTCIIPNIKHWYVAFTIQKLIITRWKESKIIWKPRCVKLQQVSELLRIICYPRCLHLCALVGLGNCCLVPWQVGIIRITRMRWDYCKDPSGFEHRTSSLQGYQYYGWNVDLWQLLTSIWRNSEMWTDRNVFRPSVSSAKNTLNLRYAQIVTLIKHCCVT